MPKVKQRAGTKGSLKWIQRAVNEFPEVLNGELIRQTGLAAESQVEWLSPLRTDDYAEYRDSAFLEKLEIDLKHRPLDSFWPARGPQWDALGRVTGGEVLLVEAKAHIDEILSPATQASQSSKRRIERSLEEVRQFLKVALSVEWSGTLYQYTNRLAHLYLLRVLNKVPTRLVFVYFVGANEMKGPQSDAEWQAALCVAKGVLGLGKRHRLSRYVTDLFVHVDELA